MVNTSTKRKVNDAASASTGLMAYDKSLSGAMGSKERAGLAVGTGAILGAGTIYHHHLQDKHAMHRLAQPVQNKGRAPNEHP